METEYKILVVIVVIAVIALVIYMVTKPSKNYSNLLWTNEQMDTLKAMLNTKYPNEKTLDLHYSFESLCTEIYQPFCQNI